MKRLVIVVTAGILVVFAGYRVFARQHTKQMGGGMMSEKVKQKCPMPECPMCMMMCKSMMDKSLIAAEDGGVILMAGCKLIKFDKDLNKVKEAEIEIDTEQMQKKMMGIMKQCPMCPMMKKHKSMMQMQGTEHKATETGAAIEEHPSSEHPMREHPR